MAPQSLAGQRALASQRATLQASVQVCVQPVAAALAASVGTELASLPYPVSRLGHPIEQLWLPVACTSARMRLHGLGQPSEELLFSGHLSLI